MPRSDRFLAACRGEAVDRTPVWFMRQAGRYLPQYRALRERHSLLEICRDPALAAEVTIQPVRLFDLDAAIVFADILLPLMPMGAQLEFAAGEGPLIRNAVRTPADVRALRPVDPGRDLSYVLRAVERCAAALGGLPLIGFAGAPFTLASYLIEGGPSRHHALTKTFMLRHPEAWGELLERLADVTGRYLRAQVEAGASAVQVFDSWAGCLSPTDYERQVLPHSRRAIAVAREAGAPVIHFGTGTAGFLELMDAAGADVLGVDWRVRLDDVWERLGPRARLQGNLDPVALLGPREEAERRALEVLEHARGRRGHVFNLGHGILPETPVENVRAVIETVHAHSRTRSRDAAGAGPVRGASATVQCSSIADAAPRGREPAGEVRPRRLAVLLMAYGGPHRLEDVEPYLMDVRGGRPTRPELLEEIRERYRRIGGGSPIVERTREQAAALERWLNRDGRGDWASARVYVGMRHWFPYIAEALAEIARDGADLGVAIAMAPQYSAMSVGAYLRKLEEARRAAGLDLKWRVVESWCDHPLLADAFAGKVRAALERLPAKAREGAAVVFTAHSLPERILAQGDPYPDEYRRTIEAVLARLPPVEWRQAWQSAGQTGERWLGPEAAEVLRELAAEGRRGVVLAPVGFLCDHVEILYDVDVAYRDLVRELGIAFERAESLNDDPLLIETLADLVGSAALAPAPAALAPAPA